MPDAGELAQGPSRRNPVPPPLRARRADRCSVLFVLLGLGFGVAFALLTPPFWGQDEIGHVARAYAVAHGDVLPQRIPSADGVDYGGAVPVTVQELADHAQANFVPPVPPPPQVDDPAEYRRLAGRPLDAPLADRSYPNTAGYSPLPYLPSAVALRLAEATGSSVGTALLLMRLADLVTWTALTCVALWSLRHHAVKWLLFVVALLPMTVFEAATVTADTLTNALALLLSALVVKAVFLRRDLTRTETLLLLAVAVLLPLAKPSYVLLTPLVLAVPPGRLGLPRWRRPAAVAATALGVLAFMAWSAASSDVRAALHRMRPGMDIAPDRQLAYVLTHLPQFARATARTLARQHDQYVSQVFGHLGATYVPVPLSVVVCCLVALLLAAGASDRLTAARWQVVAAALLVLLNVAAILVLEYLIWSPVGSPEIEGVQGRYFIPLALVTAAVVLQLVPLRLQVPTRRTAYGVTAAIVVLVTLGLSVSVSALAVTV